MTRVEVPVLVVGAGPVGLVTALPLRLMGGVHRLVLDGRAPALEAHYPSVGGDGDAVAAWPQFARTIDEHTDFLAAFVQGPVQTNEVGRCRALLGGFLAIAESTGRPLRLLELGASAGLNLRWDRYYYEARGAAWGDPASKVVLRDGFLTDPPFRAVHPAVVERQGCDLFPVDVSAPGEASTLLSYTWADQTDRIAVLRGAIEIAAEIPVVLEKALNNDPGLIGTFSPSGDSMIYVNKHGRRVTNEKLAYNESAQAFFEWDPVAAEYPNLVLFAIWDQRSQDHCASDEYGRFIVPPGQDDAHVIKGANLRELTEGIRERLARYAAQTGGLKLAARFEKNLERTVARFNKFAAAGKDRDFRRGERQVERRTRKARMRIHEVLVQLGGGGKVLQDGFQPRVARRDFQLGREVLDHGTVLLGVHAHRTALEAFQHAREHEQVLVDGCTHASKLRARAAHRKRPIPTARAADFAGA